MRHRPMRVAATAVLLLGVAACGGDDDKSSSDASTAGVGTEAASAATTAGTEAASAATTAGTEAASAATTAGTEAASAATTAGTEAGTATTAEGSAATTAGTTGGTAAGGTEEGATTGDWTVNTDDCTDPEAATAPIEGTVRIGMVAPLSGGVAATAFSPVTVGLQSYIDYANENELLPGYTLELSIVDDQYNPALTPGAVNGLLDQGVHIFTGNIGSPQNAAVMDLLNEECVPQMNALSGLKVFGDDVEGHPWTFGGQMHYDVEARAYTKAIGDEFGDGATVALFYANSEFGQTYKDAVDEVSGEFGVEIVEEQTVEATDTAPPTAQINAIASAQPDAIVAVPLGAGCPVFLNELANAKAANPGWEPAVYITNTCNSSLILAAAGATANGIITAAYNGLYDVGNPETHSMPGIAEYIAAVPAETVPTSASGWSTGETTVEILRRAAASENGLSRASIIEAARNMEYHPSMARPDANFRMEGDADGFPYEAVQLVQYDEPNKVWNDVGDLILDFESS